MIALVLMAPRGHAKLRPYFIVHTTGQDGLEPRVVFALDTSSSMTLPVTGRQYTSPFDIAAREIPGDPLESRISVVRRVIREVVEARSQSARFALFTFALLPPPTVIPPKCSHPAGATRFVWFESMLQIQPSGPVEETPLVRYPGYTGAWALCDQRPSPTALPAQHYSGTAHGGYPYLRRTHLGQGQSVPRFVNTNFSTTPVPPTPMISTAEADMKSEFNRTRKVQWFPRFMGVRTRLNWSTDPDQSILAATVGDYSPTDTLAEKQTEVWKKDFYYWPYVDGFPGYNSWATRAPADPGYSEGRYNMGVGGAPLRFDGTLLQGVFLTDEEMAALNMPAAQRGSATRAAASATLLDHAAPLIQGGVDPRTHSITPWKSTIGVIPASTVVDNQPYGAHRTVAGYLRMLSDSTSGNAACAPLVLIILTDGAPAPTGGNRAAWDTRVISSAEADEGGPALYRRLAELRRRLGVRTFVVGSFTNAHELKAMACAAAGACDGEPCATPCDDTPANAWDTCRDPSLPGTKCAYFASAQDELLAALLEIVDESLAQPLVGGPPAAVNSGPSDGAIRSHVSVTTDWPKWRGHVHRELCDDPDPSDPQRLAPWCDPAAALALEDPAEPVFGPCPSSPQWDAGECLQLHPWCERRLYSFDESNTPVRVLDPGNCTATTEFRDLLTRLGVVVAGPDAQAEADTLAAQMAGRDAPDGWKLPGLARTSAEVVRQVPRPDTSRVPAVALADPHCAGRNPAAVGADVPRSLIDYAAARHDPAARLASPVPGLPPDDFSPHRADQELVLAGDDWGVLHAFQFQSGNELWAVIPRYLLAPLAERMRVHGPETMAQPSDLAALTYGLASTPNVAWVYDFARSAWRHIAFVGMGPGGTELMAIDVGHGSPHDPRGPFEILWTTDDANLRAQYDPVLGETWSRPTLSYELHPALQEPRAWMFVASGYGAAGRHAVLASPITGNVSRTFEPTTPYVADADLYDGSYALGSDLSSASHCASRVWPELGRVYFGDVAGRILRWDVSDFKPWQTQATAANNDNEGAHSSGGRWNSEALTPLLFRACVGPASGCTVAPSHPPDPFLLPLAVTASDRIDAPGAPVTSEPQRPDRFLIAANSGAPSDDVLDMATTTLHSSLYLIVDDHSTDAHGGFSPAALAGTPQSPSNLGANPDFARIAVTDLVRTRTFTPFAGAPTHSETGRFGPRTRPASAPRIFVTQAASTAGGESHVVDDVEVYFITFTVHEPATLRCDPRFFDPATQTWHPDPGASYAIRFRLTVRDGEGFDFTQGASQGSEFATGFSRGLTLLGVDPVDSAQCADGVCGPSRGVSRVAPCEVAAPGSPPRTAHPLSITTTNHTHFRPVE